MSLQQQIKDDMVNAMKNKETAKVLLLRVVIGEFSRVGKDLTDEQVLKVIRKMSENAKTLGDVGEMGILDEYLPKMLGEGQIKIIIADIINRNGFSGMKDMGKVMGAIKQIPVASQIDGKIASEIVREMLG